MKALSDILPIYGVDQDMILSKMGDVTIGYRLELPEIFTLSSEELEAFHQAWLKAIKILPAGTVLYKQDWFTERKFAGDFLKNKSFLSQSSERFFNERPYLDHQCYLFLTRKPRGRVQPNSMYSTLLRKHIVPVETMDEVFVKEFIGIAGQFERILSDCGFVMMKRLGNAELQKCVDQYLNLGNDPVKRDISFENGIQVGEKHCALFTLADAKDLPSVCGPRITHEKYSTDKTKFSIGFATPLSQLLSCNHIYSQVILIEDGAQTIKQLEQKKLRLQSLSNYARSNAMAKNATEEFLNEAMGMGRLPVKAHFNILAWTDSHEGLQALRNQCTAALAQLDATPKIETVGGPQIFWAGIPGNAGDLPINETFTTFSNQAACFLNLETNYRSSISEWGIRLGDRVNGKPVDVDLSDQPMKTGMISNRNKLFIGPSGSGKSFTINHFLKIYYENGAHVVVVDVGHSYKRLCELVGGTYFTYSEKTPIRFNPFFIDKDRQLDTEKKESLKTLLIALWKKDDASFTRSEYVALSNALQLYYQKDILFRCFDSFYEFLRDEFVEVLRGQEVKEKDFDVSNFLYVLRPFYKGGEFDYLLNATEKLNLLIERFIVFELDNIKDHPILFPVVTIILMDLFIAKMRNLEGILKILALEEVWKALTKASMEEAIQYWVKTIRKYYGELWPVSQEIEDMIGSAIVKNAIINNCDTIILLDQSKYQNKFEQVQTMLGLPDKEVPKILSLNKANDPFLKYKEVYIWPFSKVYRVEVSREEYYAYSTEEKEKVKVENAKKKYGSLEMGIRSLVVGCCLLFAVNVHAQVPIVGQIISEVIKQIDLKVQQLQNQTLQLQLLQRQVENKLHELKLSELSNWTQKQKDLYQQYYDELKQIKSDIKKLQP